MSKQPVVIYTRVSTKEQGKSGLGLEAQLAAIQHFCAFNDLEIAFHYSEVQSGGDDDRPQLAMAFQHAKKIGAYVLVSKLDRLSRDAHFILGLMKYGQRFVTVEDGLNADVFTLQIKASVAEQERKNGSMRTKAGLGAARARGRVLGGYREGSAEKSVAVRQAKADAFAQKMKPDLDRMRDVKLTTAQIAAEWNSRGIPGPRGQVGTWHSSSVSNLLKRLYADEYKRFGRIQKQQ